MLQRLSEQVKVVLGEIPLSVTWAGHDYPVTSLGLHHTYLQGQALQHVFSVVSRDLFFRLRLDTVSLRWTLEEVSDGLPD